MAYKDLFKDGNNQSNTGSFFAEFKSEDGFVDLTVEKREDGFQDKNIHFASGPVDLAIQRSVAEEMSDQARDVTFIFIEALALFLEKNRGYGTTSEHLGARGQYADMHRKMGKLKHTLWDGNPAVGESVEEMCMDLIGHAALTINFLREAEDR